MFFPDALLPTSMIKKLPLITILCIILQVNDETKQIYHLKGFILTS